MSSDGLWGLVVVNQVFMSWEEQAEGRKATYFPGPSGIDLPAKTCSLKYYSFLGALNTPILIFWFSLQ